MAAPYLPVTSSATTNAEMNNGKLKLQFVTVLDAATNLPRIVSTTSLYNGGQWTAVNTGVESNRIFYYMKLRPMSILLG